MERELKLNPLKPTWRANICEIVTTENTGSSRVVGQVYDKELGPKIAAALDLYEALKAVVAVADRNTKEFDQARAAIKKAEAPDE